MVAILGEELLLSEDYPSAADLSAGAPESGTCPPVLVLGAGRVGGALSREIVAAKQPLAGLWNRSAVKRPEDLGDAPFEAGSEQAPQAWVEAASVIILAVRDAAIPALASALQPRAGTAVLHTSGALGSAALGTLPEGVHRGSYHPLQSFSAGLAGRSVPPYLVALEGDAEAIRRGQQLASATGHRTIRLAPEHKAGYHAAAVLASNCLVALEAAATRVMAAACQDQERAWELLWPLVMGTMTALEHGRFDAAITGPVARGDSATVRRNLDALSTDPGAQDLYRALGREVLRVASDGGLSATEAEQVRRALLED